MNKFDKFLQKHGFKIIIALLVFIYFKSCSVDSDIEDIEKDLKQNKAEIDTLTSTLSTKVITKKEMKGLIKTTPAWNTLRIEEMSDKENISINAIKAEESGYDQ